MNLMGLMGAAVVFVALGVGALGALTAVVACILRKWKFALWTLAGTLSAAVLIVAGSFLGIGYLWRPYDPTSESDLKEAYRADFEAMPPKGITVLKARQVIVGDSGGQWLLLKATPEEIERHIAKGFTPAHGIPRDFAGDAGANAPSWWKPPTTRLRLYENDHWTKSGGWWNSTAAMGVDTESGLIWFVAEKMD
jgi:hypothetical protein